MEGVGDSGDEGGREQDKPCKAQERREISGEERHYFASVLLGSLWLMCGQWTLEHKRRSWESRQEASEQALGSWWLGPGHPFHGKERS